MPHINRDHDRHEGQDSLHEINARRVDQLIDLVEKHTRTERHLEEHSNITDLDEIKYVLELQKKENIKLSILEIWLHLAEMKTFIRGK